MSFKEEFMASGLGLKSHKSNSRSSSEAFPGSRARSKALD